MKLIAIDIGDSHVQYRVHATSCREAQHEERDANDVAVVDVENRDDAIAELWADEAENLGIDPRDASHHERTKFLDCAGL